MTVQVYVDRRPRFPFLACTSTVNSIRIRYPTYTSTGSCVLRRTSASFILTTGRTRERVFRRRKESSSHRSLPHAAFFSSWTQRLPDHVRQACLRYVLSNMQPTPVVCSVFDVKHDSARCLGQGIKTPCKRILPTPNRHCCSAFQQAILVLDFTVWPSNSNRLSRIRCLEPHQSHDAALSTLRHPHGRFSLQHRRRRQSFGSHTPSADIQRSAQRVHQPRFP